MITFVFIASIFSPRANLKAKMKTRLSFRYPFSATSYWDLIIAISCSNVCVIINCPTLQSYTKRLLQKYRYISLKINSDKTTLSYFGTSKGVVTGTNKSKTLKSLFKIISTLFFNETMYLGICFYRYQEVTHLRTKVNLRSKLVAPIRDCTVETTVFTFKMFIHSIVDFKVLSFLHYLSFSISTYFCQKTSKIRV